MKKQLLALICILTSGGWSNAQIFSGTGGPISNNGMANYFTINVSGLPQGTLDGNFGVEEVCIDISHTRVDDLVIHLESPNYTTVELTSTNGGVGADYTGTCFSNSAPASITTGTAPFTGSFKPEGFLGRFHDGQNSNGNWRLRVVDVYGGLDAGSVINWSIRFGTNVAQPVNFTSSDLPIIVINTIIQPIKDEPKVMVNMGIIYNGPNTRNHLTDPFNNYNGQAMIEYRGSSSQMFDKKPYSFKTVNSAGNDIDVPLLGMPAGNDWVLHSPYSDKSLMRNHFIYSIANAMDRYAPRTRFVELVLNGRYEGVYVLAESIKRGDDRVNIAKLTETDNADDPLTGGYIIKIDKRNGANVAGWYSSIASTSPSDTVFFQYHYPEADRITPQQRAYIQGYMAAFEQAIMDPNYMDPVNGYRKFVDLESFVDFFIINEISKNVDGYRISTYMYKDKDSKGGKLTMGPVWDYDIAFANSHYGNATDPAGWQYTAYDINFPMPVWWSRIIQDTAFTSRLKCRWEQLRTSVLDPAMMNSYIDQTAAALNESQARNFTMWPTLGVVVWPNPSPVPATYQGEVDALKNWNINRIAWLDQNIPGICNQVYMETPRVTSFIDELKVFPNPFSSSAVLSYSIAEECDVKITLYDITGRAVKNIVHEHKSQGRYEMRVDASTLNSGMYFYHLQTPSGTKICKVILQK
jgi:subtilisin-like proprotein convertase family protein